MDITGTSKADTLVGTSGDDVIIAGNGADTVTAGAGDDYVDGGSGNDTIYAGDGNDTVYGSSGNDTIDGGAGDDYINGGTNNDTIYGGDGNDILIGDGGTDKIYGGNGDDWLEGDAGNDMLYGGAGNDTYYIVDANDDVIEAAGEGIDTLIGDGTTGIAGKDILRGGDGNDTLLGGGGDDVLEGGAGINVLNGGTGKDLYVLLETAMNNTFIDPDGGNVRIDAVAGSGVSSISLSLQGTTLNDVTYNGSANFSCIGNDQANVINGGSGNDVLDSGTAFAAGLGGDKFFGNAGDDILIGAGAGAQLDGGAGFDMISYANRSPNISFYPHGFTIDLNTGSTSSAYAFPDDPLGLGDLHDSFSNMEGAIGSALGDTILGDGNANRLYGMDGNDAISGGGGADTIDGGAGADVINGGAGVDVLTGGAGSDTFVFDPGQTQTSLSSMDTITDFTTAKSSPGEHDQIDLTSFGVNMTFTIRDSVDGSGSVIDILRDNGAHDFIHVLGVHAADFGLTDILTAS